MNNHRVRTLHPSWAHLAELELRWLATFDAVDSADTSPDPGPLLDARRALAHVLRRERLRNQTPKDPT